MQNYLSLVNPDNPQTCLMLSDEFEGFHAEQLKLMPAPVSLVYLDETGYGYVYGYVYGDGFGSGFGSGFGHGYVYGDGYGSGFGSGLGSGFGHGSGSKNGYGVGYAKLSLPG